MVTGQFIAVEVEPGLHRLELPGMALGIPAPPAYTELTMRRMRNGWRVVALAGRGQADDIARWLRILGATGPPRHVPREPALHAVLPRLPDALSYVASTVDVQRLGLGSDGSAFVLAAATKGRFQELLQHLESLRLPENAIPELTARQAELLQFCKDKGYYDIPRQVTLRDLAKELGISPPALSMALRRAESRILSAYVERLRHNLPAKPGKRAKRSP